MIGRPIRLTAVLRRALPLVLAWGLAGAGPAEVRPATTHTVEIRDMEFHPAELRVSPGDTIVWINRDFVPHTATAPDSSWTSPPLGRDERWSMIAPDVDAGDYVCAFHPLMEARLIVESDSSPEE